MKQIQGSRALALAALATILGSAALAATGCGGGSGVILPPDGGDATTSGSGGSGGGAGGGTASSSGGAGGATTSTTSTTSTTATTTGAGGSGGGTSAPKCLDASVFADVLVIEDAGLCVTARYSAPEPLGFASPTWGAHGGPLTLHAAMDNTFDLVRWTPPAGAMGALTKTEVHVDAKVPMGAFLGGTAVDVPFFGWTAISWTGAYPATEGEVILLKGGAVDTRYPANGAYAAAGISAANSQGRLLLTGLSPVGDKAAGPNALHAADTCGTAAMPSLLPGADVTCKAPITVATWGDSSGPVVVDHDGNAFAVMSSFDGTQEARGFEASAIARGAAATDGVTLFKIPGFGSSLAALAPTATVPGRVVYQPVDGTTYFPLDVVEQSYAVIAGKLSMVGTTKPLLHAATPKASINLMVDAQDRLWAGVDTADGTGASYLVISRTP